METDLNRGEFLEFRGMVSEHNRNVNTQLTMIQSHLDRQDAGKEESHKAIWQAVHVHEDKDAAEFKNLDDKLNEIKNMINAKLSYGKGFLAALAILSSLFGGGVALLGSNLLSLIR